LRSEISLDTGQDRCHRPAITKLLIEHQVTRLPNSIGILTLQNW